MVRLSNMEDHFDGKNASNAVFVDLNALALEYFQEANAHLFVSKEDQDLIKLIKLNITEMNLAGSLSLEQLNRTNLTHWNAPQDTEFNITRPKDKLRDVLVEVNKKVNLVTPLNSTEPFDQFPAVN
mmetsp:Transcript_32820/g.50129  ORF Transcript_32820/g.50129 Transcript_32820/m.50129 type:complete len:126 (+) Transcript_32820:4160-4537(+)